MSKRDAGGDEGVQGDIGEDVDGVEGVEGVEGAEPASAVPAAGHPSYEQARDELVEIVRRLEAGGITLEESLALWERGEELAAVCQRWLDGARARLEQAEQARARPDAG